MSATTSQNHCRSSVCANHSLLPLECCCHSATGTVGRPHTSSSRSIALSPQPWILFLGMTSRKPSTSSVSSFRLWPTRWCSTSSSTYFALFASVTRFVRPPGSSSVSSSPPSIGVPTKKSSSHSSASTFATPPGSSTACTRHLANSGSTRATSEEVMDSDSASLKKKRESGSGKGVARVIERARSRPTAKSCMRATSSEYFFPAPGSGAGSKLPSAAGRKRCGAAAMVCAMHSM
mmetsp:Transcript_57704/g.158541  ORF Transcript_57704/g.158541 Transcript_57704/m.158541 type:complete len:234 (-) Transcript_57704:42-743(-)